MYKIGGKSGEGRKMLYKSYIYYILTALFPVLSVGVSAQTMSENYVKTETVLSGNGLKSSLSVQYYDGLGRPSVLAAGGVNTEVITEPHSMLNSKH